MNAYHVDKLYGVRGRPFNLRAFSHSPIALFTFHPLSLSLPFTLLPFFSIIAVFFPVDTALNGVLSCLGERGRHSIFVCQSPDLTTASEASTRMMMIKGKIMGRIRYPLAREEIRFERSFAFKNLWDLIKSLVTVVFRVGAFHK